MRRKISVFLIIVVCYLLQSTVFEAFSFTSITPNLLIVAVSAFGFMRGKKEGLIIGFFCGLLLDIFTGSVLGFYALIYMYIGYMNGFFRKLFYPEDIKLPMLLIAGSDLSCNLVIYFFMFLFRGKFQFTYYLLDIIIPELVYTMVVTIFLYFAILKINQKLDAGEPVYLRGQIIGLQGESGKRRDHEAAYVNINGVGVLGVIPCSKWTTGFKSLKDFRDTIISNRGTIVNFRVCAKTYDGDWVKYVCSREDYLKAIGQDPWQILKKCYQPKMNVRVRVVEKGPSNDGSYFCSLDGLRDINFLSYVDEKSGLEQKDVIIGKEYYGYIQKMNPDKKFARVRLTGVVGDK